METAPTMDMGSSTEIPTEHTQMEEVLENGEERNPQLDAAQQELNKVEARLAFINAFNKNWVVGAPSYGLVALWRCLSPCVIFLF